MINLDSTIEDSFTDEQEAILKRIKRNIKRSENEYALYFVECNLPHLRDQLINQLQREDDLTLLTVDIHDYPIDTGVHIDEWLAKKTEAYKLENNNSHIDGVNIVGLEHLLPIDSEEQIIQTVSELNWRRSYFQQLQLPLSFWLPSYALELLATQACDFYDWYSDIYHCESNSFQTQHALHDQVNSLQHPDSSIFANLYQTGSDKNDHIRKMKALLDETTSLSDKAYLQEQIGVLLCSIGDIDQALEYHKKAKNISEEIDDQRSLGVVLSSIARVHIVKGEYQLALESLEYSLSISKSFNDKEGIGVNLNHIAQVHMATGNYILARDYLKNAQIILEEENKMLALSDVYNNLAVIERFNDLHEVALENLRKSQKICEDIHDKLGLSSIFTNMAYIYQELNEPEIAINYFHHALSISNELNDRLGLGSILQGIASTYRAKGDYQEALKYLEESLEVSKATDDKKQIASCLNNIANLFEKTEKYETALKYQMESFKVSKELGDKEGMAYSYYNLGSLYTTLEGKKAIKTKINFYLAYVLAKEIGLKPILNNLNINKTH